MDERAFEAGLDLFLQSILQISITNKMKDKLKELDKLYIKMTGMSFHKHYAEELGFKSIKDAKKFGEFISYCHKKGIKFPDDMPLKSRIENILRE